jgi:hypothetical protein
LQTRKPNFALPGIYDTFSPFSITPTWRREALYQTEAGSSSTIPDRLPRTGLKWKNSLENGNEEKSFGILSNGRVMITVTHEVK